MEGGKGPVCVTGGTGFIASWLIMRLLENGYSVHATVRSNPECKKDISYLTNLPGASNNLHIFNADLNQPDSFNAAIEGCTGVFHLAHQLKVSEKEPLDLVTKKELEGTIGILKACLNSKTVKKVVYTSSAATVMFGKNEQQDISDENTWSDIDLFRSLNTKYSVLIAKIITEKLALEFAEQNGLNLVSVIPPTVVGPFICPNLPGSVRLAMAMIFGKDPYYGLLNANFVHIDDVTSAHIFLLECPNAKGRYICSSEEKTIQGLAQFLSARYPNFQIPSADDPKEFELETCEEQTQALNNVFNKIEGYKAPILSSKKLLDSGFKFKYSLNEMYDGAIQSCREKGLL